MDLSSPPTFRRGFPGVSGVYLSSSVTSGSCHDLYQSEHDAGSLPICSYWWLVLRY